MKNKNSNTLMLITGIVAGAAAVYFLKSPKGQEVMDVILEKGADVKEKLSEQSKAVIKQGKDLVDEALKKGESLLEVASNQTVETKNDIIENVDETLTDFEKGIEKAKSKLKKA